MAAQGTLLYVDQGPVNGDFFFMKLFILDGILQVMLKYIFLCFASHTRKSPNFQELIAQNKAAWLSAKIQNSVTLQQKGCFVSQFLVASYTKFYFD